MQKEESLIEMQNGCICCTLREDLLIEISKLAKTGKYDYLVIESTGIAEPLQTAETFTFGNYNDTDDDDVKTNIDFHEHKHNHDNDSSKKESLFSKLDDISRLDTMVTMVDAFNFFNYLHSVQTLSQKYGNSAATACKEVKDGKNARAIASDEKQSQDTNTNTNTDKDKDKQDEQDAQDVKEDNRHVSHLLIDQIEFSNVIIINKCGKLFEKFTKNKSVKKKQLIKIWNSDNIDIKTIIKLTNNVKKGKKKYVNCLNALQSIIGLCKKLCPLSKIYLTNYAKINISNLLNTNLFSFKQASMNVGWLKQLRTKQHIPETIEYGISSFIYKSNKPFNPLKLYMFIFFILQISNKVILRAKGFIWLAHVNDIVIQWNQAGDIIDFDIIGNWFGNNMHQEIVFIGKNMNKKYITDKLNNCLLTQNEIKMGPNAWKNMFKKQLPPIFQFE